MNSDYAPTRSPRFLLWLTNLAGAGFRLLAFTAADDHRWLRPFVVNCVGTNTQPPFTTTPKTSSFTMYRKHASILVLCSVSLLVSAPLRAKAQLGGTNVTGGIFFAGNFTSNGYDPANGSVPAYLGSENTAGTTVTISNTALEFAFSDGYNTDRANFTDLTLTVGDNVGDNGALPWEQTFTDPAFNGMLTKVSDTFDGGVTASISGDTITLDWAGSGPDHAFTAVFDVGSVPEPSTWAMLGLGVGLLGLALRRRASRV